MILVPSAVKKWARLAQILHETGFKGGTPTGWSRFEDLQGDTISNDTAQAMRVWFSRHGPGAKNGGTSYQNGQSGKRFFTAFLKQDARAFTVAPSMLNKHRAFLSWCAWGGDDAFLWIQQLYPDKLKGKLCKSNRCSKVRYHILKGDIATLFSRRWSKKKKMKKKRVASR